MRRAQPHALRRSVPRGLGPASLLAVSPKGCRLRAPAAIASPDAPPQESAEDPVQIWEELRERAESAFQQASMLVPQVEAAEQHVVAARAEAEVAERLAAEAEAQVASKRPEAEGAIRDLRMALTGLKCAPMEVKVDDLHSLASRRLEDWQADHPEASSFQVVADMTATIGGLGPTHAVARLAAALVGGKRYAVVCLAVGEQLPEGRLEGTLLHWGCAWHAGSGWEPPPAGWHTDPNVSYSAGKAWQTPLACFQPQIDGQLEPGMAAYASVLQLPLEGVLKAGGLEVVLKRPTPPEWVVTDQGRNIYVSFKEASEYLEKFLAAGAVAEPAPASETAAASARASASKLARSASLQEAQKRRQAANEARRRAKESATSTSSAKAEDEVEEPAEPAEPAETPEEATARVRAALEAQIKLTKWESKAEGWTLCDTSMAAFPDDANAPLGQRLDTAIELLKTLQAVQEAKGKQLREQEGFAAARAALELADRLVDEAEHAQQEAQAARQEADRLKMAATEAESTARQLRGDAVGAVREARQASVRLKGKDEEVALADLHELAAARLASWLGWVDSRNTLDKEEQGAQAPLAWQGEEQAVQVEPPAPAAHSYRIEGVAGSLVAHVALCQEAGTFCAAVSVAAAEAFPDGLLDGSTLHWACSQRESGAWQTPHEGWSADQEGSSQADGGAIHTPMETVRLAEGQQGSNPAVQTLTLQVPLEGVARSGGLTFVIKTPTGWLSATRHNTRCDFFVSLRELGSWVAQREADKLKRELEAEAAAKRAEREAQRAQQEAEAKAQAAHQQAEAEAQRAQQEADALRAQVEADAQRAQQEAEGAQAHNQPHEPAQAGSQAPPDHAQARDDPPAAGAQPASASSGEPPAIAMGMIDDIGGRESKAERSLMHRFNIAADLLEDAIGRPDFDGGLVALTAWLRYSAARHLTWNRNYNVKPREISAAQDRLTQRLAQLYEERPELQDFVLLSMAAVGRGGQGNIGQRIRDEILDVQQKNGAKGGMMEEWHQKLHNNTSPDDVVICEALLAYLGADLDIRQYWATLQAANISKERLASFDRAIRSEPSFKKEQIPGLTRDLTAYLQTLKAVHSGADLSSAADTVLGYEQVSMKGKPVAVDPVPNVATDRLRALLKRALAPQQAEAAQLAKRAQQAEQAAGDGAQEPGGSQPEGSKLLAQLEVLLAARGELQPFLGKGNDACGGRLRDVIYLDLALEGAVRTAVEGALSQLRAWAAEGADRLPQLLKVAALCLEAASLSFSTNAELALCLKDFQASQQTEGSEAVLRANAAAERTRRALGDLAAVFTQALQPTAEALGRKLNIDPAAVSLFSEEVVRGTPAAPLSQLLAILEPVLRASAGLGSWQLISLVQGSVTGRLVVAASLAEVQQESYAEATVLLVGHVGGEEEVPEGVVAVVTPDSPDVLCHAAVRARNAGVLFASCFDAQQLAAIGELAGQQVDLQVSQDGSNVSVHKADAASRPASASAPGRLEAAGGAQPLQIRPKEWCGAYALPAGKFSADVVGSKSLNTAKLQGKLPAWIHLPPSVAIPFGTFEAVLEDGANTAVAEQLRRLTSSDAGSVDQLSACRAAVRKLHAPQALQAGLEAAFAEQGLPWPAQPCEWDSMWAAVTRVWASKWNERAVVSMRKARLEHAALRMAVLCQHVIPAAYAFVAHTSNPLTGNADECSAALGDAVKVVGLPSKSRALVLPDEATRDGANPAPVLIFRSDSNGEDLQGYAGAGLFDSVQSTAPTEIRVDYSAERLLSDAAFRQMVLAKIAIGCACVEALLAGPQDIEGVFTANGSLYIVQTRPQV
ncbi:hypothetical protein WJX72_012386 [[Myrmecia] bisecta]|uniref:Pyruvate phosphate dikinase AMP/ATP-binding domain-containing protein n=1 Tax=[Myrmecia] bisecta TaxID=41462 RepID=A0AAW1RA45_9CHLO